MNFTSILFLPLKSNDPRGPNRTFVLCYSYFCLCLELSPLVMNRHLTPNLYHLDTIWVHSFIEILHLAPIKAKFDNSLKTSILPVFLHKDKKLKVTFIVKLNI